MPPARSISVSNTTAHSGRSAFDPVSQQQHQLFAVTNLNVGPAWEVNAGYGKALTRAGDRRLVKFILGRRFGHGS